MAAPGAFRFVARSCPPVGFSICATTIAGAAEPYDAAVIVNDRADLALMSGAAGVHVGQDDLPPAPVRDLLGPDASRRLLDAHESSRSSEACGRAGHLHRGRSGFRHAHEGHWLQAVGLALVSEAVRRSRGLPVVAIGGITLDTAASVWAAGASSVAVISDLLEGGDPARRECGRTCKWRPPRTRL